MEPTAMMKVINSLNALTAALGELTNKVNSEYINTFEELVPEEAEKKITLDELKAFLGQKVHEGIAVRR